MKKLNLAFIWHMHQPLYKDNLSGKYLMPWVRLHAIKDYLDMALILEKFPKLKQTFNLVPCLIEQLEDYAYNHVSDPYLDLSRIPVEKLSNSKKGKILELFFDLNWEKMVYKFPRYAEILNKRERLRKKNNDHFSKIAIEFKSQEILDLTVWFNIAWFDYIWQTQDDLLVELIKKDRNFTHEDREKLLEKQFEIIRKIIPEYKKLQEQGNIEITTTPYYHPILPLLFDTDSAKVARPQLNLPEHNYSYLEDVDIQIKRAVEKYENLFHKRPKGFWPSEQSVSQDIIKYFQKNNVNWIISDEGILFNSIKNFPHRDNNDLFLDPTILYQPYLVGDEKNQTAILFRDVVLSDLIGFIYSKMDANNAAYNLYGKIKEIQNRLPDDYPYLVTIALDGENCWEHYDNDGYDFLNNFYTLIENDDSINMTSVSDYLEKHPPKRHITNLFSGSWIRADFTTWIGDKTKNKAWDYLYLAREVLSEFEKNNPNSEVLKKAWEEIYIAEGSDWFWWFGEGNTSSHDDIFDWQFRLHLQNVYKLIGSDIPEELKHSVEQNFKETHDNKNLYDFSHRTGTMQQALKIFEKIYYDHDEQYFNIRMDLCENYHNNDIEIYVKSNKNLSSKLVFEDTEIKSDFKANFGLVIRGDISKVWEKTFSVYKAEDNKWKKIAISTDIKFHDSTIELKIPYKVFNTQDEKFSFVVIGYKGETIEEFTEKIKYYIK
ncbi:MAG: glycoside hydrolase family 57 protein [Candidatus Sericytochromatia bacterium]